MYLRLFSSSPIFVRVVLASYPSVMGNGPRNYQRRCVIAVLHLLSRLSGEDIAIVDICMVVCGSIALCLLRVHEA